MAEQPPYEYQPWPSWRFGPNGQKAIFQSEEEVPDGWTDSPHKAAQDTDEAASPESEDKVSALMQKTADDLVGMLEAMKEIDDSIEFVKNWPKLRLARTIVAHGGPLPETEE